MSSDADPPRLAADRPPRTSFKIGKEILTLHAAEGDDEVGDGGVHF